MRDADGTCATGSRCAWSWDGDHCPPQARVLDDAAPTLILPTRDPAEALAVLAAREVRSRLAGGRPDARRGVPAAPASSTRSSAYLAPALLGAGPAAVGDLGIPPSTGRLRLTDRDVRTIGPDVRIRATTSQGGPLMFTGIVEELGEIVARRARRRLRRPAGARAARRRATPRTAPRSAVNGVCLTVVEHDAESFTVDVMAETLHRTSLGRR